MTKTIICLVTICVLVFYWRASSAMEWPFVGWHRDELGQFGDSWGVITSIFSALAFIGVVFTVYSQHESLKKLKSDSKKQDEFLNTQKFENNLFQMLNFLQNIIKDMDIRVTRGKEARMIIHTGRDVFAYFYKSSFHKECKAKLVTKKSIFSNTIDYRKHLAEAFDKFYESKQQDLGHYLRFLYNIFKYIETSNISSEDKFKYAGIVRAQISDYELLLLMYNCFTKNGEPFIKYIEKYMLLDNISFKKMFHEGHALLIPINSFGAQGELVVEIDKRINSKGKI
ncbi:putative phage abortive infection protein [Ewingella americana]